MIVADGTVVHLQLPPFTAQHTATFYQPDDARVCHDELCSLVAKLAKELSDAP